VECKIGDGKVTMQVAASAGIDLELWAVERAGEVFRQIYGLPVVFARNRK
jgi:hypothetical protein